MYFFIHTIIISFLLPTSVSAKTKKNWLAPTAKCAEHESLLNALPNEMNKDEVLSILHPQPMVDQADGREMPCLLISQEWFGEKNSTIVLYETVTFVPSGIGGYKEKPRQVAMAILRKAPSGSKLEIIAKTEKPIELKKNEKVSILDLAPYKLTHEKRAFGFRGAIQYMYSGGGGSNETLRLFQLREKQILPILETVMSSSSSIAGESDEDGNRARVENEGGEAIIHVLKSKTNGYFDWEKSEKGSKKPKAIFRWNGRHYESKDKDPVEDINS